MNFIELHEGFAEDFLAHYPADTPVDMLNLLRFREQAVYQPGDNADPCTGFEAFVRYGAGVMPMIDAAGGEQIWQGRQAAMLIGPQDKDWQLAVLMRYPSAGAFVAMVTSPQYRAVAIHRTAALEDSRLIAMQAR